MSILNAIDREYQNMKDRGWDRIFLFFDLHGTVIKPNFVVGNTDIIYYPYAKETLLFLSDKKDVDLNIYTCSHDHEILEYQRKFKEDGIFFKYVNENPDVQTNGYGNYDKKDLDRFFNIIINEVVCGYLPEENQENHFIRFKKDLIDSINKIEY